MDEMSSNAQSRDATLSRMEWEGESAMHSDNLAREEMQRPVTRAVARFQETLAGCGTGCIFRRYLKPISNFEHRGAALGAIRTDDFVP
jgi:uncharacterized protein (DUF983 family)